MTIFVDYKRYSLLIPYDVLSALGDPKYIQLRWNNPARRIVILAAAESDAEVLDVPAKMDECSIFVLPHFVSDDNPIAAMNWGTQAHSVEPVLVKSPEGIALLIDLNTAKAIDHLDRQYVYMMSGALDDEEDVEEDEEDCDDEE